MDIAVILTIELSTDEIQTISDEPAFTIQALLNDLAGNSGMLLGISILDLFFPSKRCQFLLCRSFNQGKLSFSVLPFQR